MNAARIKSVHALGNQMLENGTKNGAGGSLRKFNPAWSRMIPDFGSCGMKLWYSPQDATFHQLLDGLVIEDSDESVV